ncbi:MAG TPA: ankyrin repeat domain-containing protein [Campylobacterales bacterium]|nr:ankyrin repeat domain-containing protein [Campylobacterales bacterium]
MRKAIETHNSTQSEYFLEMAKERLMLEEFLVENVDVNQRDAEGKNALYWAIKTSHKHNINLLLSHGVSPMVKPNYHALFHTIRSNNLEAFALFLGSCNEINMQNERGQTLLMVAIEMENSIMVQYLINHGINLFTKDKNGFTALEYAKKAKNRMVFDLVYYKIVYEKSQKVA